MKEVGEEYAVYFTNIIQAGPSDSLTESVFAHNTTRLNHHFRITANQ